MAPTQRWPPMATGPTWNPTQTVAKQVLAGALRSSPRNLSWTTPGATSLRTSPTPKSTLSLSTGGSSPPGGAMSPHPTGKGADFGLNFLYENRFKKAWAYTRGIHGRARLGEWADPSWGSTRKRSLPRTTRAGWLRPVSTLRLRPLSTGTTVPAPAPQGRRRGLQPQPPLRLRGS